MKNDKTKSHNIMAAITFAEAGEWETARSFMQSTRSASLISMVERIFAAVAFAEADMSQEAIRISDMNYRHAPRRCGCCETFLDLCGLQGIRFSYTTLSPVELITER